MIYENKNDFSNKDNKEVLSIKLCCCMGLLNLLMKY